MSLQETYASPNARRPTLTLAKREVAAKDPIGPEFERGLTRALRWAFFKDPKSHPNERFAAFNRRKHRARFAKAER